VAVVSGLPPASYRPVSGTGVAAAHVAAAAALVLAHHPQFGPQVSRDANRVDQLFYLILAFCRPLPAIGRLRSGAGLPNVPAAVGVAPWGNHHLLVDGAAHPAAPSPASRTPEDMPAGALTPLDAAMQSAGLIPG
jgi:subtilisin family serine protease